MTSINQKLVRQFGRPVMTGGINAILLGSQYGMDKAFYTKGGMKINILLYGSLLGTASTTISELFLNFVAPSIKNDNAATLTNMAISSLTTAGGALAITKFLNSDIGFVSSDAMKIGLATWLADSASDRIFRELVEPIEDEAGF
jgi:hypothetical protein